MSVVATRVRTPATSALRDIQAPVRERLDDVAAEMRRIVTADLPMIEQVSGHLLQMRGKMFRPTLATTVLLVGATTWMAAARLVRGEALSIREREFVAAARAAGASPLRVAMHHVLPHATAVLGVEAALRLGQAVLLEASLSFLGLGVPPPVSSWGGLIADGRDRLLDAWWIATWPGIALAGVVIAASLVADGARERL